VIIVIPALGFARVNCRVNMENDLLALPDFHHWGYWTDNERLLKKSLAGRKEVGIFLFWRKETWK
jgi:hypothetical protein